MSLKPRPRNFSRKRAQSPSPEMEEGLMRPGDLNTPRTQTMRPRTLTTAAVGARATDRLAETGLKFNRSQG